MTKTINLLRCLLATVFLALTIQSADAAVNVERRNQMVRGKPPMRPQGPTAQCAGGLGKVPNIKSQCSKLLASENSLTVTSTATTTSTTTLAPVTSTIPVTVTGYSTITTDTATLSPSITNTVTSTLTSFSSTTTHSTTITSTSTVTPTTTTTVTSLTTSPTLSPRSLDVKEANNEQVSKRGWPWWWWNLSCFQNFWKLYGQEIINDACVYIVYGNQPVPTDIVTATQTATSTPKPVTITSTSTSVINTIAETTITLPTVTVTQTNTATITTLSVAPTSTITQSTTVTGTSTTTVTSTVPASQITGYFTSGGNNIRLYEYTDTSGTHITDRYDADGLVYVSGSGIQYQGTPGTYVYDVASQGFQDCTSGSCNSNFMGAHNGYSYVYMGSDPRTAVNPLLITCSLSSVLNGPIQCNLQNGNSTNYQFADCSDQHAMYFLDATNIAEGISCYSNPLTFVQTGFS